MRTLFAKGLIWGLVFSMTGAFFPGFLHVPAGFAFADPVNADGDWYYLRDRLPLAADENPVDILIVGDVMLGRGVSGVKNPFRLATNEIRAADIAVGNFEGVFASAKAIKSKHRATSNATRINLLVPINKREGLYAAGFDLMSLANNHSLDMGNRGLEHTVALLTGGGIQVAGVSNSEMEAFRPVIFQVRDVRIAFLSINAIPEPGANSQPDKKGWQIATWDPSKILPAIKEARQKADAVIVMIHWGYEYEPRCSHLQKDAAQAMVDAGAAVIVGSHPHVIQETAVLRSSVDEQKPSFVAYSLGNFVFDQFGEPTNYGLALHIFVDKTGLRGVRPGVVKTGLSPEFITNEDAEEILKRNKPRPEILEFACSHSSCRAVPAHQEYQDGRFVSGEIDLSGDGIAEKVLLQNERVSIIEKGKIVWQSPVEWQVLDVALGDPNLDGRGEIALALQKPDQDGNIKSHPFLIGFRGGIYRQVWGGSAVVNPILEIEVADIDGDRDQELIVLEQNKNGTDRSVVVWRYDSWFFNPVWRSAPGEYENLGVLPGEGSEKMWIVVTRPW